MSNWPNRVTLGDFTADESSLDGDFITVKVTGWDDAPPIRLSLVDRAQQDGGWDAAGVRGMRVVTLEGVVMAASGEAAKATADALKALPVRDQMTLTVSNEFVGERSAQVRLQVGAVLDWQDESTFTYTVQVVAPDPLLYGPPVTLSTTLAGIAGTGRAWPRTWPRDWGVPAGTTPGSVSVPNDGTAPYWATLRIDGPVINPVVTLNETGDWVRVGRTILAGQWLDIDCASRSVMLNGSVSLAAAVTSSGRWLGVPVGGGSMSYNADSADAAAVLTINGFEGAFL